MVGEPDFIVELAPSVVEIMVSLMNGIEGHSVVARNWCHFSR